MARQLHYNAAEHIAPETAQILIFVRPSRSATACGELVWNLCWAIFFRFSPRPLFAWRALLLRIFGAKLGPNCKFYPSARVWAPWNLICSDLVAVGDGAEIYNPAPVRIGSHAILSQNSYLCGATHDFDDPGFPLLAYTMEVGAYAWVAARACVAPGVNLGEGSVLGLASVATRDLEPWAVYGGSPAVKVKQRNKTTR